jgi:outer membrane biosynthesis protein TonB
VAALLKTLTFWPNKMIAEVPVEIEPDPQELAEAEPPEQEPPEEPPEHQEPPDVEIEVEDVQPKRRAKAAPKTKKAAPKAPAAPKPKPRKPKATIEPSSPVAPRGRFDTFSSLEMAAELLHRRQTSARDQRRLVYKSWLE